MDRYQRAASYAERIERELRGLGVWRSAPLSDAADLDAEYLRKMEDVLAVYEKPYRAAEPVVCLDEKPVSLHADLRAPLPARPGQVAKRDNEYKRCGTANVFVAVEPKAGRHFTFPTPDRSAPELAPVLNRIIGI